MHYFGGYCSCFRPTKKFYNYLLYRMSYHSQLPTGRDPIYPSSTGQIEVACVWKADTGPPDKPVNRSRDRTMALKSCRPQGGCSWHGDGHTHNTVTVGVLNGRIKVRQGVNCYILATSKKTPVLFIIIIYFFCHCSVAFYTGLPLIERRDGLDEPIRNQMLWLVRN